MPKSCPPPPLAAPRPRARLYTHLALAQTHIHPVYTHPGVYSVYEPCCDYAPSARVYAPTCVYAPDAANMM